MGIIADTLKEIPLSSVLRERLIDLQAEIDRLQKENAQLKKEKSEFIEKINQLSQEHSQTKASAEKFIEYRGAKFERLPSYSYDETVVYCFHCESPMTDKGWTVPFKCRCGYESPWPHCELGNKIIQKLNEKAQLTSR